MEVLVKSEEETIQQARALVSELGSGDLIYLHGTLGMGKSVFARGLIRALCGDADMDVPSPTFTLVQVYDGESCPIYHFDLYRIEDEEEIFELGWEDALYEGITIVEWPERLGGYKRQPSLDITLSKPENGDEHMRQITIERHR